MSTGGLTNHRSRKRQPNAHVGGEQPALFMPASTWAPPAELPDLRHRGLRVALDVENRDDGLGAGRGSSWPFRGGHICGLALAWEGSSGYFPTGHPDTENFDAGQVAQWVRDHAAAGVRFITHHGSHDWGWLRADWEVETPREGLDDTEAMAMIVDENRLSYKLDDICRWRGLPGKDEVLLREAAAALGYPDVKAAIHRCPARYVGAYAEADVRPLLEVGRQLDAVIDAEGTREGYRLEMDLVPMVLEMRRRGVRVNLARAEEAIKRLTHQRDVVLAHLSGLLGRRVGLDEVRSPRVLEQLFVSQRVPFPRTERTHQGSFQASWMRRHEHWLPRLVARAEQLEEAASKFLQGFIVDYAHRGRVHASINQYRGEEGGTRSFRFSYSDPALQQMHSRREEWRDTSVLSPFELEMLRPVEEALWVPKPEWDLPAVIRGCFEPEDGERWLAADYSQQEYRLIVHFAVLLGCERAAEAADQYRSDPKTDFHLMVSAMTGLARKPAKDTNFAKAFGAGVPKFAAMIGKSIEEAAAIFSQYDEQMPFVRQLAQRCQKAAEARGYIRLIDGTRSHFDMWEPTWREQGEAYAAPRPLELARVAWPEKRLRRAFAHKAMNRLIQGSAARQMKAAMRACWREGIVPLLQMHDELGLSVADKATGERVRELMRDVIALEVPMAVDAEYGRTWGEAKLPWEEASSLEDAVL